MRLEGWLQRTNSRPSTRNGLPLSRETRVKNALLRACECIADLILRSRAPWRGVSKDGQKLRNSRPSFETRVKNALLRMRPEIVSHALGMRSESVSPA